ncbi:imidazole glycerol phosphate synthase subunit HisH [Pseudomonas mosselii]|uniref:imidazole glycerol phosphate synthase subunit HisH n=1 Tax=Pseudomonas mosselii TaxID=78327 RepID=UPI00244D3E78|nr:imidazole glycerol phosphate synthase subunit HisH [Pseudomonas mosselii]MDH1657954.1 imidazole glycerol phosphate synthase subunit HisH [Pseudomonas mosselii]MDH1714902.1 imidazole glycerol phosphate synthase subunit HisH [Pseudomonas mosselii]MDH1721647.1 imidazole glycerol phosphate synthase subunit HisH [Pseudomonas mosselii]
MITIIDYGLGNIQAFVNVYRRLHIPVAVAQTAEQLENATKLILPGVGAFDHAIERLTDSGMRPKLDSLVQRDQVPVLGICVGMQILADSSEEGSLPGLGWVPGRVRSFKSVPDLDQLALPHMGWNDVMPVLGAPLFKGFEEEARFYFLHSYFFECNEKIHACATSSYGLEFSCAVQSGNVYGVQFHPEKSHHFGVGLLKNFAEL